MINPSIEWTVIVHNQDFAVHEKGSIAPLWLQHRAPGNGTGTIADVNGRLQEAVAAGQVRSFAHGTTRGPDPNSTQRDTGDNYRQEVLVTEEFDRVTIVGMLNPSVDWMVATEVKMPLVQGETGEQLTEVLDIGVASGDSFSRQTGQIGPPEAVHTLDEGPVSTNPPRRPWAVVRMVMDEANCDFR